MKLKEVVQILYLFYSQGSKLELVQHKNPDSIAPTRKTQPPICHTTKRNGLLQNFSICLQGKVLPDVATELEPFYVFFDKQKQ